MPIGDYKKMIKNKIRSAVFEALKFTQSTHNKVENIIYNSFINLQPYITHPMYTIGKCTLLFNL